MAEYVLDPIYEYLPSPPQFGTLETNCSAKMHTQHFDLVGWPTSFIIHNLLGPFT